MNAASFVLHSDGWAQAGAIAAIAAALATAILAGVTAKLARETKRLAEEARRATGATMREADVSTLDLGGNAARDRVLAWRP